MPRTPSRILALSALAALSLSVVPAPPACKSRSALELAAQIFQPDVASAEPRAEAPRARELPAAPMLAAAAGPPLERVTNLAASAAPIVEPPPGWVDGEGPWMRGTRVAQTERVDLYVGLKTFSAEQVAALAPRLEAALRHGEERIGTTLGRRVSLAFYRPALAPSRGTRGIAYTEEGRAEVFYRPYEEPGRALTIAAHELAHHIQAERYGAAAQKRADTILLEGMATWITGDVWLAQYGAPHWRGRARQIRDSGVPMRLLGAQRFGPDTSYELWASFVDFLVSNYGLEKVDALYRSSVSREPGSADYEGVLGKPLDALADDWRAWVDL